MRTKRIPSRRSVWESRIAYLPLALAVGCCMLSAGLMGVAGLMQFSDAPEWMLSLMAGVVLVSSGYGMGYFSGFHRRKRGMQTGLFCGIILCCILWAFGMAWQQIGGGLIRILCVCVASTWGGIVGVNRQHKKPPR